MSERKAKYSFTVGRYPLLQKRIVFWAMILLLPLIADCCLLFTVVNAQATKSFEASSFATLAVSTGTTQKLQGVVGGISGANSVGATKKICPGIANTSHSPGVVSTLATSTASVSEGQVQLDWTHTGRDGNFGQASSFEIKVATVPITYSNYPSINASLNVTALSPGATSQRIISNLPPGQLYYMAIRTRDSANMYSRISANSTFYTTAIAPDPVSSLSIVSSSSGFIGLNWAVTGDDASSGNLNPGYFRIDYSTDPSHSFNNTVYAAQISTTAAAGSQQFYSLSSMLGNATYYATVYIGDDVTVYSGLSNIAQAITEAYPPSAASFSDISTGSFSLSFSAYNSPDTEYLVEISSYADFSFSLSSGWTSSVSISFQDLQANTTYYLKGKARNFSGLETQFASLSSVYLPKVSDTYSPREPAASAEISAGIFTLFWKEVKTDILSNPVQIKRYEIYKSTSASGIISKIASVSSNTFSYSEAVSGNYWYYVTAVDLNNSSSGNSAWFSNFRDYARIVSDDRMAEAEIPSDFSSSLAYAGLSLSMKAVPEALKAGVSSAYRLYLRNEAGSEFFRDLPGGSAGLILPLSLSGGIGLEAVKPAVSYSPYDYAVYYDNGVEQVKLGGVVDTDKGIIYVETAKTGLFLVKRVIRAQGFSITKTVPKKIFTPNSDGIFDEFNILYDNPQDLEIREGKIYDLSGMQVASLRPGTYNSRSSLMWDGKTSAGEKASAGIYIYQFKAGDKYYNGTVVLAR